MEFEKELNKLTVERCCRDEICNAEILRITKAHNELVDKCNESTRLFTVQEDMIDYVARDFYNKCVDKRKYKRLHSARLDMYNNLVDENARLEKENRLLKPKLEITRQCLEHVHDNLTRLGVELRIKMSTILDMQKQIEDLRLINQGNEDVILKLNDRIQELSTPHVFTEEEKNTVQLIPTVIHQLEESNMLVRRDAEVFPPLQLRCWECHEEIENSGIYRNHYLYCHKCSVNITTIIDNIN